MLVILAILAALIIPSMTGWIDKAKAQRYVADARLVYNAAQSAISEQYGLNPEFANGIKFRANGSDAGPGQGEYGRVSNNILYKMQNGGTVTGEQGVDAAIAEQVLEYLDSSRKSTARYPLSSSIRPTGGRNVYDYYDSVKQAGIVIVYNKAGSVVYIEFGYEHTLVHIDERGLTTTKDGSFSTTANGRS